MRRHLTLVLLLLTVISMAAQETTDSLGIHPYKPTEFLASEKSNWSLWLSGGFPFADFDFGVQQKSPIHFNADGTAELPAFNLGLAGEYNWNNTFGIGAQYKFRSMQVRGKDDYNLEDLYNAHFHQATAFISLDLFNAWRKVQAKKIFALNLMAGAGAAWYKRTQYYTPTAYIGSTGTIQYNKLSTDNKEDADSKYICTPVWSLGALFEFNISRSLALGVGAWYNNFTRDDIEGRISGSNSDGVWDLELTLRYKIDAVKKSHYRNFVNEESWDEQYAKSHPGYKQGAGGAGNGNRNPDTVVVYHRDTMVIFHRDTIVMLGESSSESKDLTSKLYHYVYFDNDQAVINDQGLISIQQVASRMEREPEKCAIITGFCDNTGSTGYNDKLSARRALNVYDELQQEHLIDTARMVCFSKGILYGNRSKNAYTPNRRVDILIVDKDEFDQLKKENKDNITTRKTASTREERRVNPGGTTQVAEGMTLSKLAREYYGNTHCWVYIYQANQDRMSDPSMLPDNVELMIPELTDEQMKITQEQARELYLSLGK